MLRYLGAFGPATVADIQAWSGLSRLREVTERLGSALRPAAGPDGERCSTCPDAPRPGPDVPAPPRFLPEYDNLLLSFARRDRVNPGARPVPLPPGHGAAGGTVLVDGFWAGGWTLTRSRDRPSWRSARSPGWPRRTGTRWRPKAAACSTSPPADPAASGDVRVLAPESG